MMKIRFLAIFAAVLTLHVFVEGGLVEPEYKYDCYWKVANASDRVCRNHDQDVSKSLTVPLSGALIIGPKRGMYNEPTVRAVITIAEIF
uniref:Putative secreted protein n=1 Tax=Ixodes scapularis TaxID=6945 RepID=Q4PN13_IXOSC|nr:putative secreted protein [Ixodes scapularis]